MGRCTRRQAGRPLRSAVQVRAGRGRRARLPISGTPAPQTFCLRHAVTSRTHGPGPEAARVSSEHPPLPERQPKPGASPRRGLRRPQPHHALPGSAWLSPSRSPEAGTAPELTPTRAGGEEAAQPAERMRRGPAAKPGRGRDRGRSRRRRRRAQAQADRRRRRGARGPAAGVQGGPARWWPEDMQKWPRILTQPGLQALSFRLRHIAAARARPAASNLATTCESGAWAGPAWGPERSERLTVMGNGRARVCFLWILAFGPRDQRLLTR